MKLNENIFAKYLFLSIHNIYKFFSLFICYSQEQKEKEVGQQCSTAPDSGDSDPGNGPQGQSWFKRTFKASLAFQLVILTFVCLSCLFEPRCCDYMNNYSWSFSPKLHYEGRPPI